MVQIETIDHRVVDGDEPREACCSVEDTSQATLLARHASQLSIRAVEDVSQTQQQDSHDVQHQTNDTTIVVAGTGEEEGTACSDEHREDSHRIGMYVKACKEQSPVVAERAHKVQVQPVFCL